MNPSLNESLVSIKHTARVVLYHLFGKERVDVWASRIPYRRVTYCLVAWQVMVPENTERRLHESGFVLREGTYKDLDRLEGEILYGNCGQYREWFRCGQRFIVAEADGRPISYVWIDFSKSIMLEDLPEYCVEIASQAFYVHEAWTLPAYRGRSLRRLTFLAELLLARREGKRWDLAYQLKEETLAEMLRNFERTGVPRGNVIGEVGVVQFGGFRFTWRNRLRTNHPAARFLPVRG